VGHTGTGTLGDSRAPADGCELLRCPGWRIQESPGLNRESVNSLQLTIRATASICELMEDEATSLSHLGM
jgi:hypothetical protein